VDVSTAGRHADPLVASLDDAAARRLRAAGVRVVRSVADEPAAARAEAVTMGADFLRLPAHAGERPGERLVALREGHDHVVEQRLRSLLAAEGA